MLPGFELGCFGFWSLVLDVDVAASGSFAELVLGMESVETRVLGYATHNSQHTVRADLGYLEFGSCFYSLVAVFEPGYLSKEAKLRRTTVHFDLKALFLTKLLQPTKPDETIGSFECFRHCAILKRFFVSKESSSIFFDILHQTGFSKSPNGHPFKILKYLHC